jgi:hypothetical protein
VTDELIIVFQILACFWAVVTGLRQVSKRRYSTILRRGLGKAQSHSFKGRGAIYIGLWRILMATILLVAAATAILNGYHSGFGVLFFWLIVLGVGEAGLLRAYFYKEYMKQYNNLSISSDQRKHGPSGN